MPGLRPKPYRIFNRVILGIAAGLLLTFTAFNTWINPLWVTPTAWTDEKFAEYRPIYRQQRTGKAGIARFRPWKVAFFGSSRADIAFDPMLALPEAYMEGEVDIVEGDLIGLLRIV